MEKKLPNIYKKQVPKNIKNNRNEYHINDNIIKNEVYKDDGSTVEQKLRKLFKSSRYIFNIGVIIETSNKTYDTKIAGQVKNSIVTVDGEVIPIIEIKNIIIKDRL